MWVSALVLAFTEFQELWLQVQMVVLARVVRVVPSAPAVPAPIRSRARPASSTLCQLSLLSLPVSCAAKAISRWAPLLFARFAVLLSHLCLSCLLFLLLVSLFILLLSRVLRVATATRQAWPAAHARRCAMLALSPAAVPHSARPAQRTSGALKAALQRRNTAVRITRSQLPAARVCKRVCAKLAIMDRLVGTF